MASYAVITKVIIHNRVSSEADSVAGSYAKAIKDYLDTIDDAKVVSIHSVEISNSGSIMTVIITKA